MNKWNVVIGVAGAGKTSHAMGLLEQKLKEGLNWNQIGFLSFSRAACAEAVSRAAKITGESEERLRNEGWFRTVHAAAAKTLQVQSGNVIDTETKAGKEFFQQHFGVTPDSDAGSFGERVQTLLNKWALDRQMVWPLIDQTNCPDYPNDANQSHPRTRLAPDSHPLRGGGAPMRNHEKHCKKCLFRGQKNQFLYLYRGNLFSSESTLTAQIGCEGASFSVTPIYNKDLRLAPPPLGGCEEGARVRVFQNCPSCGEIVDDHDDYGDSRDWIVKYERQKQLFGKYDFTDMVAKFAGVDFSSGFAKLDTPLGDAPADVHVWLVDEAQDCSNLLWLAIERLTVNAHERYLLGDPYQAVYKFIGAEPAELLRQQEEARSEGNLCVLARSWRNPPEVVNWGEEILSEDPNYISRKPFSETTSGSTALLEYHDFVKHAEKLADKSVMILGRTWYSLEKPIKILNTLGIPWTSVSEKHSSKWDCPQKIAYVLTMRDLIQKKPISEQDWRRITKVLPAKHRGQPVFTRGTKAKWDKLACSHENNIHYHQLTELGAEPQFFEMLHNDHWKSDMFLLIDNAIDQWGINVVRRPSVRVGTAHSVKGMEADIVYCMSLSTEASANSDPHEERCLRYVAVTRAAKHFRLIVDSADILRGKPVFWPAPKGFNHYDHQQEFLNERVSDPSTDHQVSADPWDMDGEVPRISKDSPWDTGRSLLSQRPLPSAGSQTAGEATHPNPDLRTTEDQEEWWDF